jgi:hypothetical protein
MTFNPKAYTIRSDENVEKFQARKKWREENAHLSIPFFIEALRGQVPSVFPGELAMLGTASGEGKTFIIDQWNAQVEEALTASKRRAVTVRASQEETTERMQATAIEKMGASKASSMQTVWVGANWGMDSNEIEDLHMTNIISTLHFARNDGFAEPMPFAGIFYDYMQATPADPERRKQMTEELRRLQIRDDTKRLFDAAKTFTCPVVAAAQTMLKKANTPYNKDMLIPSQRDFEEAAGIFQIPDYVYTFWLARATHAVGKTIEIDNWKFRVEKNLVFMWFLKARGHNPDTAKGISKVFPIRIIDDKYTYDPEYHASMVVGAS